MALMLLPFITHSKYFSPPLITTLQRSYFSNRFLTAFGRLQTEWVFSDPITREQRNILKGNTENLVTHSLISHDSLFLNILWAGGLNLCRHPLFLFPSIFFQKLISWFDYEGAQNDSWCWLSIYHRLHVNADYLQSIWMYNESPETQKLSIFLLFF